jgi:chemotaxis protein methyltransferase CheR
MNYHLSDDWYVRFRDLLLNRCGLFFPERKRDDLAQGISSIMATGEYAHLAMLYADAVHGGPGWNLLVTRLTIGETYFFRNGPQFDALRSNIIPDLLARRASTRSLRCWSAGCATGEEPYSIAMLLTDLLPTTDDWQTSILATDINQESLARAKEALYGDWSFRETSVTQRSRFFINEGNRWRLRPEIQRMVHFAPLNLAEASYPSITTNTSSLDLILCRNVTIYFDEATTRQVATRFYNALTPGGWLIVGHSEPQATVYHQFEVHNFPGAVIYRKPLQAALFPPSGKEREPLFALPKPAIPVAAPRAAMPTAKTAPVQAHNPLPTALPVVQFQPIAADLRQLLESAWERANSGSWIEAESFCREALDQDQLCIEAHYLLGQIHEHQARADEAVASYRRAVYLDRTFVMGIIGMARVRLHMGALADARRLYRNALQQLALARDAEVPLCAEGTTVRDLVALAKAQLHHIDERGV